jgi:DNA-binding NarL/FixJ family response regulator
LNININVNINVNFDSVEEFKKFCKVLYLEREYPNHLGNADWLIISDLSEEQLQKRFSETLSKYIPYILLSNEQGEPILESIRNNHKHEMRSKRTTEPFDYDDELLPLFHSELLSFVDPLEEKEKIIERAKEEHALDELIIKVQKTLSLMKPIQRERLIKNVVRGLSSRKIAKEEGVNYSTVDKSIRAAKKNFQNIYKKL